MPVLKKVFALSFLLFVGSSQAAGPRPGPVVEVPAKETCQEHITTAPRMTINDWPKRARGRDISAYVLISYDLDGTGKAKNLVVTDSKPKGLFDKASLSLLERTDFAPDVQAKSCTYVRTYGAVKRSER